MNPKFTHIAVKIDRLSAWVLFFVFIAYAVTGYGMTKGLINIETARAWHLGWLGPIGLTAFVLHTSWAIHLFLRRHNIWNLATKISLYLFYIFLILFFVYIHIYYSAPKVASPLAADQSQNPAGAVSTASTVYTASTLRIYDGLNGRPAFVAVDGAVYDVSAQFRGGSHHGYGAGQDLSAAFHGQHMDSYLQGLPVVGSYQGN